MPETGPCLTVEDFEHLARRSCSDNARTRLMAHIESCPACRLRHEECLANEAALNSLRRMTPSAEAGEEGARPFSDSIPGYSITQELKRGGQGVVYKAVQKSTQRNVAIKVMREGPFAGAGDKARFDREIRALSQLKHPNIVTIHDSGTAAGSFYFIMDYIEGRPFDVWMEERFANAATLAESRAAMRDVIRVFALICDAVNAAHLRGTIHRDLKPSNICIDAQDVPHILDFGLAKVAADENDTQHTAMTRTGQFVGSLPWASPEQAQGLPDLIDVRTDVYSLGVLLYQVLTGAFPYVVMGGVRDVLDNIVNVEPKRPRNATLGVNRSARLIDDELETIALKCLAKEPAARYQTAGELARDLDRYLNGEPIEAKRDSIGYVLRKQIKRHRFRAASAAALLIVIVVGFVVSFTQWRRAESLRLVAEREKTGAIEARNAEREQKEEAQTARDRALTEAAKASAVIEFLQEMLAAVDPSNAQGNRDVTVREVLENASEQINNGAISDQPEVEAAVRRTIGRTFDSLALFDMGEPHLRRALAIYREAGDDAAYDYSNTLNDLATLLQDKGELAEAEALFREAVQTCRMMFDGPHADTAAALNNLAIVLALRGEAAAASQCLDEALEMSKAVYGEGTPEYATILGNIAKLRFDLGDIEGSLTLLRESLKSRRELYGDKHPALSEAINNLAFVLHAAGRLDEAEPLFREAAEMDTALFGEIHPQRAIGLNNLSLLLLDAGKLEEAETVQREALAIRRKTLPPDHPELASSLGNLASILVQTGEYPEAEKLTRELLALPDSAWPPGNLMRLQAEGLLAQTLIGQQRYAEAEPILLAVQEKFAAQPDAPPEAVALANERIRLLYELWDKPQKAAAKPADD